MAKKLQTVVLVGRPNVGKSTLFNRIAGVRRAIVAPGHADRGEICRWLGTWDGRPSRVHLTHGKPEARAALADLLRETRRLEVHAPDYMDHVEI